MAFSRPMLVKLSFLLNGVVLLYLILTIFFPLQVDKLSETSYLDCIFRRQSLNENLGFSVGVGFESGSQEPIKGSTMKQTAIGINSVTNSTSIEKSDEFFEEPSRELQQDVTSANDSLLSMSPLLETPDPPANSLESKMYPGLRNCPTIQPQFKHSQSGNFWILENYVKSEQSFRCDESITYTTHADFTFLDNLDPLTSRWQGPVSVAVFAPGTDFKRTIESIQYVRNCMGDGVRKYVTFHLFFPITHVPSKIPSPEEVLQLNVSCLVPVWETLNTTYRNDNQLLYPVNVARNLARNKAITFFNFPSDIELYPSVGFIRDFFAMLRKPDVSKTKNPRVFVFPIFEVSKEEQVPETKAQLQTLLKKKLAVPFHKYVCPHCHSQPGSEDWEKDNSTTLSVFHVGKRIGKQKSWEPIYVGTCAEPLYDERLNWEGKSDKMTQMYILCVQDYEFHILSTAFLVHKPGIKKYVKDKTRDKLATVQRKLILYKILPAYKIIFGAKKGCTV